MLVLADERVPFDQHKVSQENRIPPFAPTHAQRAHQVVSEVNLDKSSPNNDHVGDAANGYASNVSSTNGTEHTNGYSPNATEPSNVDYYYYCSGLDVSAGGTIDCGSTIGTTAAEGPAESTPYSTLR